MSERTGRASTTSSRRDAVPEPDMKHASAFEPASLDRARRGVDLGTAGLVPVNDPTAWSLWKEHEGGFRHVWEHKTTGWLSQTLTVPRWALADPPKARAWHEGKGARSA